MTDVTKALENHVPVVDQFEVTVGTMIDRLGTLLPKGTRLPRDWEVDEGILHKEHRLTIRMQTEHGARYYSINGVSFRKARNWPDDFPAIEKLYRDIESGWLDELAAFLANWTARTENATAALKAFTKDA